MGPDIFEEFGIPYNSRLYRPWRGGLLHNCGPNPCKHPYLDHDPPIKGLNCSYRHSHKECSDFREIFAGWGLNPEPGVCLLFRSQPGIILAKLTDCSICTKIRGWLKESPMLKTISSSDLRAQIKRVLNEVGYGRVQYVVEKFGEPMAAIVSIEDFRLLQSVRQRQATSSLQEIIADIRARSRSLDLDELDGLIEEARAEFHAQRSSQSDVASQAR